MSGRTTDQDTAWTTFGNLPWDGDVYRSDQDTAWTTFGNPRWNGDMCTMYLHIFGV